MKIRYSLNLLFSLLILVSCASSTVVNTANLAEEKKHLTREEIQALNASAMSRVSNRLAELSIAAKASGPDKVRFLASDMYLKASAALMEGDYQTANIIFKHLLTLTPEDNFVKHKYAISLIRTGELAQSQVLLKSVFKTTKDSDQKLKSGLVLAGVYASLGNIKGSRGVYKTVLKKNPKNEEACIFLGKSYAIEKKYKKAIRLLTKCESRNTKKGIYSYYIGKIYVDLKNYKKAMRSFKRSQKRQKNFAQATIGLGLIYEELGKHKKAKRAYKKYLKMNPHDTMVLSRLVQLMFTHEEFKDVIPYAEVLSDYEPDNLNLKVKLGILYKDIRNYDKAIRTFKDLLTFAPDNDNILYYLGAIFQETKRYSDAIEYFAKVQATSGLYQDSSLQIAQLLSSMAKLEHSEGSANRTGHQRFITFIDKKIEELAAFKVDFSVIKASYLESVEANKEAIDTLETVQKHKDFKNDHRFYLAALYEKEKDFSESRDIINEIIQLDPKNAHAWNFLGYSLLERGENLDTAHDYILKAVKLSPNDGYIRDSLGWYYYKMGETKKALKELRLAIKSVPADISINKHLAVVYTSVKKFTKAKFYIKQALTAVQTDKERNELLEALQALDQNRVPASFLDKK
jgi:tetratricopeptide (TPR) repeat protein